MRGRPLERKQPRYGSADLIKSGTIHPRAWVTVSLTRTLLWLYSPGIFDKDYARATAGSSDEHAEVTPDLFTAEPPLGTYQGMTDNVVLSRTPGSFRAVLVPRGSSKPEWL